MAFLKRVRNWYARYERPFSSISLIGGFVFDAVTLKRVDLFWENFWVIGHLLIVTVCAIIINRTTTTDRAEENPDRLHFWLVNVMQFFFGGILSTYLVFYFRGGAIATSWPFLLLLAAAFIANERLKRHFARQAFQMTLLFLSFYAFTIYLLPILFHAIGLSLFLLAGAVSLIAIAIVILASKAYTRKSFIAVGVVFLAVNTLYFLKFIPPLPLSLKDGGIYQSLTVNGPGDYTVTTEDYGPWGFLSWSPPVHILPNQSVSAYTAIFSPTAFSADITHEWQFYDASKRAWITRARINLPITGGRDGGWRTFSTVSSITPGPWRVNVETTDGRVIGQLRFSAIITLQPPALITREVN